MDPVEVARLCQRPGVEGSLWRLIRALDPDKVKQWLYEERTTKGLGLEDAMNCVAELQGLIAFIFASQLGGDKKEAIIGSRGLIERTKLSVTHKLDKVGGGHKIITSTSKLVV